MSIAGSSSASGGVAAVGASITAFNGITGGGAGGGGVTTDITNFAGGSISAITGIYPLISGTSAGSSLVATPPAGHGIAVSRSLFTGGPGGGSNGNVGSVGSAGGMGSFGSGGGGGGGGTTGGAGGKAGPGLVIIETF
jgi:hypothetical protein